MPICLKQFLASENSLKMTKNVFVISSKLISFLRYLKFYPDFCAHVEKRPDKKVKINLKIYDVKAWETNNCNIHIA